jgi:cobalamin biosynthesis Mg chelatase CobN
MKNIAYVTIILALFAASCSSNKGGLITKRKYTKGYYVDLGKKHGKAKSQEQKTASVKKSSPTPEVVAAPVKIEVTAPVVSQEAPVVTANAASAPVQINTVKPLNAAPAVTEKKSVKTAVRNYVQAQRAMNKISHQKGKASDSELIIMVILSLFPILALVAIWLHDGKTITLNFWIDLLLHFLFIYWLFALLVVLDVINLA